MSALTRLRSSKLFSIIVLIASWYVLYQGYLWLITESTDNAYIEADISIVSSEVNAAITEVYVKENTMVEAGQIIAKLDESEYKALFDKAVSHVEGARHDIEIIEAQIKLAKIEQGKALEDFEFAEANNKVAQTDFKRITELKKDKYASAKRLDDSEIAFEKAKTEFSQSKLNLEMAAEKLSLLEVQRLAASAKLAVLEQEKKLAERAVSHTTLRAPISGMIGNSSLRKGNYVRAGVPLFSVVPMNQLYIKANFKETQISKFTPGMNADFTIDSEPGYKFTGKIRNISPATGAKFSLLPPANATGNFTKIVQRVPVLIDFDIPEKLEGKLVPGMSTIVTVKVD